MLTSADHRGEIDDFFAEFDRASTQEDWSRYRDLFLPDFLNLDPTTAAPLARDTLVAFLPRRKALFERAGATGTRLADVQVLSLDAVHALARTRWDVLFDHDRPAVVLEATFLLRRDDRWRVAVYLNHHSLPALLAAGPT